MNNHIQIDAKNYGFLKIAETANSTVASSYRGIHVVLTLIDKATDFSVNYGNQVNLINWLRFNGKSITD
jgi:hypothetical protein